MTRFRLALLGMAVWCGTAVAKAQTADLIVQRNAEGLYLTHQVAPKENFYSIGRLFNISPKVIAPFNGLALNGGLSIGQVIKVPLKDQNFTSVKKKDAAIQVLVPVYRMAEGKKVLAGYLKVNKGESPLATGGPAVSAPAGEAVAATEKPVMEKPVTPVSKAPVTTKTPEVKTPDAGTTAGTPGDAGSVDPLVTPAKTVAAPAPAPVKKKKVAPPPAPAPETTAVAHGTPTLTPTHPAVPEVPAASPRYNGEGSFHPDYLSQTDEGRKTRSTNGLAGVFKSTSGWDNGKFYALMKGVERGTVVKVTNLSNNKVVFAKVLGDIADIKQNSGMLIVLSDAAVSQLGANTDRFTASITYAK
ncbi:MAG TPA: LysM peptidoglycan-binding domain-containing protein [Dinghuibacter sp.]|uniref:LysM peptidoglycan-binding domain-containing protein n=1 Tax=Dinghuibacter sp. TaxID=2024697 RepID=UPI002D0982E2|nr:LysM peptidoglycan-binding domain-containing protein [Dinghuibacter sp.]HTJ12734.1 LysM peptidoglycan-binding domain-containing protein [Dinghuibacter sp.]